MSFHLLTLICAGDYPFCGKPLIFDLPNPPDRLCHFWGRHLFAGTKPDYDLCPPMHTFPHTFGVLPLAECAVTQGLKPPSSGVRLPLAASPAQEVGGLEKQQPGPFPRPGRIYLSSPLRLLGPQDCSSPPMFLSSPFVAAACLGGCLGCSGAVLVLP